MHAFANDPSLVLDGVLESVSADLIFESNRTFRHHYLGRVRITEGLGNWGSRVLQPNVRHDHDQDGRAGTRFVPAAQNR